MMTRLPRPRDGRVTHPLEDIPSLEEAHDQRVGDRDDFLAWVNSRVPDRRSRCTTAMQPLAARCGPATNL